MATRAELKSALSFAEAHRLLRYDPEAGKLYWRLDRICGPRVIRKAGDEAGSVADSGYRIIVVNYSRLYAHRLAWFMAHGQWPERQLDHKDLDRGNNRLANLRPASNGQNMANTKVRAKTGFKGVIVPKRAPNCFVAQISINSRPKYLGTFKTAEAAHAAYMKAAVERHGEFARAR